MGAENSNNSNDIKDKKVENEGLIVGSDIIQFPSNDLMTCARSICKIFAGTQKSSGFLIKLFKEKNDFFCLFTNEHIITKELIKNRVDITFYYDHEKKQCEITLDPEKRYIKEFREIDLDVTVIEILPEDKIDNSFFLLPLIDNSNQLNKLKDREITIIHYPSAEILSHSDGKIKNINKYEFGHSASTEKGSSGGAIILKDNTKVIGIHKSGTIDNSENYGDFILPIFDYFKNGFKYKIFYDNGDYYIGNLKDNKRNGYGILYSESGKVKYDGEFFEDKFEGNGTYFWKSGEYYVGQWKNNKRNGKGILYYPDYPNGTIEYDGEYVNDKKEGDGRYNYKNKEYYIGKWKYDKRNGKGILYYKNGNIKYEGDFINDKKCGTGRYNYEDGEYYIGKWKNDIMEGKGILYYKNGKIKYYGNFIKNNFDGAGKYILDDDYYYIGQFKNGKMEGKGKVYNKNDILIYEGDFANNKYEGQGKFINDNGFYYVGEFKKGKKQGKGILYYKNDNVMYEGDFNNNNCEGYGKFFFENGDYYIGKWKNNLKNGKGIIYDKNGNIKVEGIFINDELQKNPQ